MICCNKVRNMDLFFGIWLLLFFFPVTVLAEEPVRVGGTGGALSAIKLLAAEFSKTHPGTTVKIMPSMGSTGGIKAVSAGDIDIGLSSRPLSETEQGLIARVFGRSPLVFATMHNKASGFTLKELADIYGGTIGNWQDKQPIRVVLRPATEFDIMLLKSMSPEMERAVSDALARKGMIRAVTDQDSADAIETVPGALGTTTLAQIISEKRPLKVLTVNGVRPSLETLKNGSYPFFKTYYLITKPAPRPAAKAFIDFVISGPGRGILNRSGYQVISR